MGAVRIYGDSSGYVEISAPAVGSAQSVELPTALDTLTASVALKADANATYVTPSFSSNDYIFALTDKDKFVLASNGVTAGTLTVPTDASVNFPVGTIITIVQTGSGQLTLVGQSGVTINSEGAKTKLKAQYASAQIIKTAANTWLAIGNLSA